jgi:hypothetical protein
MSVVRSISPALMTITSEIIYAKCTPKISLERVRLCNRRCGDALQCSHSLPAYYSKYVLEGVP